MATEVSSHCMLVPLPTVAATTLLASFELAATAPKLLHQSLIFAVIVQMTKADTVH